MDSLMTEFASCVVQALRMGPENEVAGIIKETISLLRMRISAGFAHGFMLAPGQAADNNNQLPAYQYPNQALLQEEPNEDAQLDEGRVAKKRKVMKCCIDECLDQPTHGWYMVKPIACKNHADAGMDEYEPKKRCNIIKDHASISQCKKQPTYGWPGFRYILDCTCGRSEP
jgi:hypothetical protein